MLYVYESADKIICEYAKDANGDVLVEKRCVFGKEHIAREQIEGIQKIEDIVKETESVDECRQGTYDSKNYADSDSLVNMFLADKRQTDIYSSHVMKQ